MADGGTGNLPVIALDAMGGDRAPEEIVAGAVRAVAELDVEILLAGPPEVLAPLLRTVAAGITVLPAQEIIAMGDEPANAVRTKKDSSLVRCAEAVRDGRAAAMVGAGNTGATMAAALLRMGRIKGVARPAIAVPLPVPGSERGSILLDAGATVDPEPAWLVQWARLGSRVRHRAVRHRRTDHRAAVERRGGGQGRRPAQAGGRAARRREGLHRQRRRPRPVVRRRRRGRHRRLHRQRRVEDARRRDARNRGPRLLGRGRARVGVGRRGLEAAAPRSRRAAAPGQHGRRGAARRERHLRDLARFVVGGCDRERDPGRA